MRKMLCLALVMIGLTCSSHADTDIYHTPAGNQLSEKEARTLMAAFYQELWGVDITPCFRKGGVYGALRSRISVAGQYRGGLLGHLHGV